MGVQVRVSGVPLDLDPESSFALEMDNPMFDDTGMPTAYSTQIAFLPSPDNLKTFGYIDVLMFDPQVKELTAEIWICGIPVFHGTLVYDSIEDGKINYTFSGKDIESEWSTKIWQKRILQPADGQEHVKELFTDIWEGNYLGIYAPVMVNRDNTGSGDTGVLSSKYHNFAGGSLYETPPVYNTRKVFTPVFVISRILNNEFLLIDEEEDIAGYLRELCMVGIYKVDTDTSVNGWPSDRVEIETALPDVTAGEVIKNVLKLFCATLYTDGARYRMLSAGTVLAAEPACDWTGKLHDGWSSGIEEGCKYSFSYANDSSENVFDIADAADIPDYGRLADVVGNLNSTKPNARHSDIGDVYSWSSGGTDMVLHNRKDIEVGDDEGSTYDNSVDFDLVRSIPLELTVGNIFYPPDPDDPQDPGWTDHIRIYRMCPIVEPGTLGERGTKMYVGLMSQSQLVDKGISFSFNEAISSGDLAPEDHDSGLSIAPQDLYPEFHKGFAEWVSKERQLVTADLNLSPVDIASFRMWQKVLLHGRAFIVKKLSFTFYADSDRIDTSGEFVSL